MEIMLWAFGGVAAVVAAIIAAALWVVFVRDREAPNTRNHSRARTRRARRKHRKGGGRTTR
ncbi:hypothetical protein KUL25_03235 [Rhodobacteraceae bacterium N5(2021)]|uniref:Uncharacterized protein n=1 Tax=Gymnodinialimonas phycosphaerae TaxID=2841589 RepID=A0A975YGK1_9RHOB|nr:hypothetical protein [Gymnodinialimonas phycosphaerae]MBY4891777.1 hypothetical protein [Gymnodinialimonas phycosphaerae]